MEKYTTYNITTGEIEGCMSTNSLENLTYYDYIIGEYDGTTNYIIDEEVVERPLLTSIATFDKTTFNADGEDSATISGVPECVVVVQNLDDTFYPMYNDEITDGVLSVSTTASGTYKVTIECFPYQKYVVELEAV